MLRYLRAAAMVIALLACLAAGMACGAGDQPPADNQTSATDNQTDGQTAPTDNQTGPTDKQTGPTDNQTGPTDNQTGPTDNQTQPTMEDEVLSLVNQARAAEGLEPLVRVDAMDSLALGHSQDMARTGVLSHDGFAERAASIQQQLGASRVGENVAVGYPTAQAFVSGWLGSPGHRANIMNTAYRRTGIGYSGGYATQIFCD